MVEQEKINRGNKKQGKKKKKKNLNLIDLNKKY